MTGVPASSGPFEIGRDGPGVVVVGLDGSATSQDALAYAIGMGRREGSEVVVVVVGSPFDAATAAAAVGAVGAALLTAEQAHEPEPLDPERVAALEELIPGRWRLERRQGDPANELEQVAKDFQADAIVIGRSRNPGRHLLGSVAGRLVRHANHPVIVVP